MNDILSEAEAHRHQCVRETIAHELSAEYHRSRNIFWGGVAETVSAIAGTSIFVGLLTTYGLSDKGQFSVPTNSSGLAIFLLVLLLSISSPVLTAVRRVFHDAEDFIGHSTATSAYKLVWMKFEIFILRHKDADGSTDQRFAAIDELKAILSEYAALAEKSIPLTRRAYRDADAEIKRRSDSDVDTRPITSASTHP